MTLAVYDRVRETTTTTGTGTITLLGAVVGYQTFNVVGNGNTTYYTIAGQGTAEWEVGIGTFTLSGTTLARTTVLSNSLGTTALISFSAGTKDVFVTYPSEKAVYLDASGNITPASVGPLTVTSLTDSGLTATRVTYAGTGGLLTDSANLTFDGTTLTSTGFAGPLTGAVTGNASTATALQTARTIFGQSFNGTANVTGSVTSSALTSGRVTYAGTGGLLQDDADLTFDGSTLTTLNAAYTGTLTGGTGVVNLGSGQFYKDASGKVLIGASSSDLTATTRAMVIGSEGFAVQYAGTTGTYFKVTPGAANDVVALIADARTGAYPSMIFGTSATERMRIDSSGNVGIGTSGPETKLDVSSVPDSNWGNATLFETTSTTANVGGMLTFSGFKTAQSAKAIFAQIKGGKENSTSGNEAGYLSFSTNNNSAYVERMRIDSSGSLLVGTTASAAYSQNTIVGTSVLSNHSLSVVHNATDSAVRGIGVNCPNYAGNDGYLYIGSRSDGDRIFIKTSGNVLNSNNSYGALSDAKLKKNIVDATPKLAKLMQVKIRNYNLKTDPTHKQIGVVAQELEEVFPNLVEESTLPDGSDTIKTVKYSVFVPMLIKAMQEQQALIEALTTRLTILENK